MGDKRLYLVDATAFCYRAFYAVRGLSTSFGQPTNAIYGFVNILRKILKEEHPEYLAVCFDVSRQTFRQKKFSAYKIHRPPMPDDLKSQIPLIREIVSAYGIAMVEKEGFEADDIIATLAKRAKADGFSSLIVSSDKDILQLVDDETLVFCPHKDEDVLYDRKKVQERFAAPPEGIPDLIALMGDAVDNIPGVPGVGEKTACALLAQFGSLENLLRNIEKIKQEKVRIAVSGHLEQINLSRELAVLDQEVEIDFSLAALKIGKPNQQELYRLFKYLEFKKFLQELPAQGAALPELEAREISDSEFGRIFAAKDKLYVYSGGKVNLTFCSAGNFFRLGKIGGNVKRALAGSGVKKISHDLKKLKVELAKEGLDLEGLHFDTMLAAYLLNPSKSAYSPADLAWDYLAEPPRKKELGPEHTLDLVVKLAPVLESQLREKSLFKLFSELEMPLAGVLAEMELNGIKLGLEVLKKLSADIENRLVKLIEEIYGLSGAQFNINSPKQLREILFVRLKLPVVKRSKTGPSTDEEVLRALSAKHKLPALLLEYRQLTKLKNTYIDTLPELIDQRTGRIHTSFNQAGTETGRLSSSNPNLQNIPIKTDIGSNIRRAIISSGPDYDLLSCDYSQIELRILAHLSGDPGLKQAFLEDKDIHKETAALIYGLPDNDITDAMRDVAKRVNFGIVYGQTAYGLARDLGIGFDGAQAFIDAYFARYPRVKAYIEAQIGKAREEGFVTTILGRRRYIPEINNKNQGIRQFAERQAVNTPIQGSASDLIKLAMIQIQQEIKARKLKTEMILQIHDELVFDLPEKELGELSKLAKERMENVLQLEVPVRVSMKKGKNWLEMEEVK
ncbi:MAG: DNA polymerase I [Candidatus Omnitrophota bacterium]|nr:DNA polymerase I [Candidatus Omnitrophota bacterium]